MQTMRDLFRSFDTNKCVPPRFAALVRGPDNERVCCAGITRSTATSSVPRWEVWCTELCVYGACSHGCGTGELGRGAFNLTPADVGMLEKRFFPPGG